MIRFLFHRHFSGNNPMGLTSGHNKYDLRVHTVDNIYQVSFKLVKHVKEVRLTYQFLVSMLEGHNWIAVCLSDLDFMNIIKLYMLYMFHCNADQYTNNALTTGTQFKTSTIMMTILKPKQFCDTLTTRTSNQPCTCQLIKTLLNSLKSFM